MGLISLICALYARFYLFIGLVLYLAAVRILRYRRVQTLNEEFKSSDSKSGLTPAQAQRILRVPLAYDMPWISDMTLKYAIFKTYGIPTISKLLNKTKQLVKKETSGKRYIDTQLLVNCWLYCPIYGPGSGAACPINNAEIDPRNAIALSRTNWLHARYPSISNDDLLYTLSILIIEPIRWSKENDWRGFTELECQASFVLWKEIGRRMNIKDIPPTYEGLVAWSEDYERKYMVPSENNRAVAARTMELMLYNVPEALKPLGQVIVSCLMEDRLREAVCVPPPPAFLQKLVKGLLRARSFVIRHFALPRLMPSCPVEDRPRFVSGDGSSSLPRLQSIRYENEPWYYPESKGLRKVLETVLIKLNLVAPSQLPGSHFKSEGYRLEELGPPELDKAGLEKVMQMAEAMQGAPIAGPFSLDASASVGCPMGFRSQ